PGFVRTKMTKGLPAAPLAIGPSDVAAAVVQGLESSRHVVWAPSVLRYAFAVMRLLPAAIWKRLPA
ncbi:MAG: decaprenylphospho-beta-D-erythro-pentofuranosid-2-ulose 2-reductase, partial [Acidimicrobiales bacterium]